MNSTRSNSPSLAIIGYGAMGKEIENAAIAAGMQIQCIMDRDATGVPPTIDRNTLLGVDVCVEFTTPASALNNIRACAEAGKNLVVGTTGWYEKMPDVRHIIDANATGLIYAGNFSIGVQVYLRMLEKAAILLKKLPDYDVSVHEVHHTRKEDAPSGTAHSIANILLKHSVVKQYIGQVPQKGPVPKEMLVVSSSRVGSVTGIHTVTFESAADSIELRHSARTRCGFAQGALLAARWIVGKKGVYTMEDLLDDIESV